MSTKLAIILLVLLSLIFSIGIGAVALRGKEEDPDPNQPPSFATSLDGLMSFFAPALDIARVEVKRGVIDVGARVLTIPAGSANRVCLLQVASSDQELRVLELELITEGTVTVVSFENKKTEKHEPKALEISVPMRLAFREKGGTVEIGVTTTAACKIRFVKS